MTRHSNRKGTGSKICWLNLKKKELGKVPLNFFRSLFIFLLAKKRAPQSLGLAALDFPVLLRSAGRCGTRSANTASLRAIPAAPAMLGLRGKG